MMMDCATRFFRLRLARVSLVGGLVVAIGFAVGWSRPREAAEEIMPTLGLISGELITIDQDQMGKSEMAFQMDGRDYVMDYTFNSNRSKQFRLMVQQENGELVEQAAPASNTIRGSLRGIEGSRVTGCITADGCCAKIQMPSGEKCYIEPINRTIVDPGFAGVHVVYSEDEVIALEGQCGTHTNLAQEVAGADESPATPAIAASGSFLECELAVDSDFEYFSIFGSTEATLSQIELIINIVNDQYESEVGIRHTISTAVIRPTANDPYSATLANDLLDELQTVYNPRRTAGFDGDLCHLFTGKNLDGNTIGLAFVGAVCSRFSGFGLSQNVSRLSSVTDLVAHEIGHNWNQEHCNCPNHTMNSFLTGANDFNDTLTVPSLIAYRNTRNCLDAIVSPQNDDLDEATPISGTNFSVTGFNGDATTEAEEPNLTEIGSSVWWTVNAAESGSITINTFGSDFDTQLSVYEFASGQDLDDLVLLSTNDDFDGGRQSQVTFDVTAGTSYGIRVGGFRNSQTIGDGSEGNIDLSGTFVPEAALMGDLNLDERVDFSDISMFISLLSTGEFQPEADFDDNGVVDFSDISSFIAALAGS